MNSKSREKVLQRLGYLLDLNIPSHMLIREKIVIMHEIRQSFDRCSTLIFLWGRETSYASCNGILRTGPTRIYYMN